MKPDILVAHALPDRQMAALSRDYTLHRLDQVQGAAADALLEKAGPVCSAMIASGHQTVNDDLLDKLSALRMLSCSSAGYENIDIEALRRRGIRMTNTSDALVDDVADTALMLLLAARRHLVRGDAYVRSGDWGRNGAMPLTPSTAGQRAGIIGLGNIGKAIATRCEAIGLEVGYTGRSRKPDVDYPYFDDPVALAEWADILIVATPGGPETAGLISREVLDALGQAGSFVNIARGTVVDEPALIAALRDGRLASAGLDVFLNEPNPDPAFQGLPNVVLYPHHASGTDATRDRMAQMAVDNVAAFLAGQPLVSTVI